MNFRVGPFSYTLRRVVGPIEHAGQRCLGLCDNERHELLISDAMSPAQQVQVICHEYLEAWLYHFGQDVKDKEALCDLFGLALTQFVLDLAPALGLPGTDAHRLASALRDVLVLPRSERDLAPLPIQPATLRGYRVSQHYEHDEDRTWRLRIIEPLRE